MTTQFINYNKCIGEKGHIQNNWSVGYNNLKRELKFQIVRSVNYLFLEVKWFEFLSKIYNDVLLNEECYWNNYRLDIMEIIKSTRNINEKGEQQLSFILLFILWNFEKKLAYTIFQNFVIEVFGESPCGSMKDIKYFCDYIYRKSLNKNHKFINVIMDISYRICKLDEENYEKNIENNEVKLTLFGKWFPRNKSKRFGWVNKKFAKLYYKNHPKMRGQKKLRQLLVKFNNYLDTVEIKLSKKGSLSLINFENVPNYALLKYRKKFLKGGGKDTSLDEDSCYDNFCNFIDKKMSKRNYKNVYFYKLTNCMLKRECSYFDYKFLHKMWIIKSISPIYEEFLNKKSIIFCDTSMSFYNNQLMLDNAMTISVLLSEYSHSDYNNRVISFNTDAKWLNFDNCITVSDKINMLKSHSKIGYSNIYNAIQLFLHGLIINNVRKETVDELTLYIVSDFQIDINYNSLNIATLYENIMLFFNDAGLQTCWKIAYTVPKIVFWNLKSTNGFPCKTYYKNCVMKSGFNFK
tara:strand:+ start:840 stop:2396 length:1557 start_codon:yes stop_codon:yes gene_type:complete